MGRRLSSDDPDTDDLSNTDEASNSWRYLFNRVGDLVAVRDPRGTVGRPLIGATKSAFRRKRLNR